MTGPNEVPAAWGPRRLLFTGAAVVVLVLIVLAGLSFAIYAAVESARRPAPASATSTTTAVDVAAGVGGGGQGRQDAIAAAPMLRVSPQAGRGGTPTLTPAPSIIVPAAATLGVADVPSGFPRTAGGAVGQLAAIETTVLQSMSVQRAVSVYEAWSAAGAPPVESWEVAEAVQAFLASGAGQYVDDPSTTVVTVPAAAQVKGVDGGGWVLACVLLDVKATALTQARAAYGHCERMQWSASGQGRWVIAAGAAPAPAPSTWPGTDLAREAAWRTWQEASSS